jgi:hypothetical protein
MTTAPPKGRTNTTEQHRLLGRQAWRDGRVLPAGAPPGGQGSVRAHHSQAGCDTAAGRRATCPAPAGRPPFLPSQIPCRLLVMAFVPGRGLHVRDPAAPDVAALEASFRHSHAHLELQLLHVLSPTQHPPQNHSVNVHLHTHPPPPPVGALLGARDACCDVRAPTLGRRRCRDLNH